MELYKIIDVNEGDCSVIVEYGHFDPIKIDLPINDDGMVPEGKELDIYIIGMLPQAYVERMRLISKGVKNIHNIKELAEKPTNPDIVLPEEETERARQLEFIDYLESL